MVYIENEIEGEILSYDMKECEFSGKKMIINEGGKKMEVRKKEEWKQIGEEGVVGGMGKDMDGGKKLYYVELPVEDSEERDEEESRGVYEVGN